MGGISVLVEGMIELRMDFINSRPAQAGRITEVEVEAGIIMRQGIFFPGGGWSRTDACSISFSFSGLFCGVYDCLFVRTIVVYH